MPGFKTTPSITLVLLLDWYRRASFITYSVQHGLETTPRMRLKIRRPAHRKSRLFFVLSCVFGLLTKPGEPKTSSCSTHAALCPPYARLLKPDLALNDDVGGRRWQALARSTGGVPNVLPHRIESSTPNPLLLTIDEHVSRVIAHLCKLKPRAALDR